MASDLSTFRFSLYTFLSRWRRVSRCPDVDDDEQEEYNDEDDGHEGSEFGCESSLACIGIDVGGEGLESFVAFGEERDGEVVDAEREGEYPSAYHAALEFGHEYLEECLPAGCPEVECCLVDVWIHLCEAWHDAEHDVWCAEGDVCQYDGGVALCHSERYEEYEERYTCDDVGVEHRYVVHEVDDLTLLAVPLVDADGCHGAEEGGDGCCHDCDEERALDGAYE